MQRRMARPFSPDQLIEAAWGTPVTLRGGPPVSGSADAQRQPSSWASRAQGRPHRHRACDAARSRASARGCRWVLTPDLLEDALTETTLVPPARTEGPGAARTPGLSAVARANRRRPGEQRRRLGFTDAQSHLGGPSPKRGGLQPARQQPGQAEAAHENETKTRCA